jgi:hypothetical protein
VDLEFNVVWYFNEEELRRLAVKSSVEIISIKQEGPARGNPLVHMQAQTHKQAREFLIAIMIEKDWSVMAVSSSRKFMQSYVEGILLRGERQ